MSADTQSFHALPGGGGTQIWNGYGCPAGRLDYYPLTKPKNTEICNPSSNQINKMVHFTTDQ